jgi:hypothetical protein
MKRVVLASLAAIALCAAGEAARLYAQEKPKIQIPNPGVPQIMTMEGKFVRAAYNNEAYMIIGYQVANRSIGDEWMMLDLGTTVLDKTPAYVLKRDALSIETPDGTTIPMASTEEYRKADLRALENRARIQRDSINYFPPMASQACRIGFFAQLGSPAMPFDQVELSNRRACVGRIYFHVPGGIKYGQHWLNVKFEKGLLRAPFRILTEDEEKTLSKNYKDIEKQVKEAFAPPKKKKD